MNTVSVWWLLIVVLKIIYLTNANWITGNLCWSMPCMNGGSCFGSAYTYLCICPINYDGILCEKRLGACRENPCSNRGLCVETSLTSFECRCYYGYMGRTCEEHVLKKNSNIWSSLSPVHTRILFDMLQEAYHEKLKGKSSIDMNNGQIDFMSLLSTTEATLAMSMIVEKTSITRQNETIEKEHIIQAQDIQLEKIFSHTTIASTLDITTNEFTKQSSQFDNSTTFLSDPETIMIENMTTTIIEQHPSTLINTTEDPEIVHITEQTNTLITSTPIQWMDDANTIDDMTTQNLIEETNTNGESVVFPATKTINIIVDDDDYDDDDKSDSLDQIITSPIDTSEHNATTNSQIAYSQLFYKFYQQILRNTSLASDSSFVNNNNNTADVLLSWLRKHFSSLTTTMETPTVPSLLINDIRTSSIPLQRIDMDDVLYQMDNNIDNEH